MCVCMKTLDRNLSPWYCRLCLPQIPVLNPDAPCDGIRWDLSEVTGA